MSSEKNVIFSEIAESKHFGICNCHSCNWFANNNDLGENIVYILNNSNICFAVGNNKEGIDPTWFTFTPCKECEEACKESGLVKTCLECDQKEVTLQHLIEESELHPDHKAALSFFVHLAEPNAVKKKRMAELV